MGRGRRRSRHKQQRGGALTSMRGGFRSVVKGGGGTPSTKRRWFWNLLTVGLLVAAGVMLMRRFGVIH